MLIQDEAMRRAAGGKDLIFCFLCGQLTELPAIFWMGNSPGVDVWLHPDCAASFIMRLARDVEEHKLRSKQDLKFV